MEALAGLMGTAVSKRAGSNHNRAGRDNNNHNRAGSSDDHNRPRDRSRSRRQQRRNDSRSVSHRRRRSPTPRQRREPDRRRRSPTRGRSRSTRRQSHRSPTPRTTYRSLTPRREGREATPPRKPPGRGAAPKKNRQLTPYKEEDKKDGSANAEGITQLLAICGGDSPIDDTQFPKWDTNLEGFLKELAKAPTVSKEKLDTLLEKNGLNKAHTNGKVGKLQQLLNFICNCE